MKKKEGNYKGIYNIGDNYDYLSNIAEDEEEKMNKKKVLNQKVLSIKIRFFSWTFSLLLLWLFFNHPKQQLEEEEIERIEQKNNNKKNFFPIQCHEINGSVHLAAIYNKVYKNFYQKTS